MSIVCIKVKADGSSSEDIAERSSVKCKENRAKDRALRNTNMKSWRSRTTRVDRDKLRTIQKIRREERSAEPDTPKVEVSL